MQKSFYKSRVPWPTFEKEKFFLLMNNNTAQP